MESKICQFCQQPFALAEDDFAFFEKLQVPPPTFCPQCRLQRFLSFRNARNLYKRTDSKTGKEIISLYSSDKNYKVYEQKAWNGDDWDPMEYSRDIDWNRPFLEQVKELTHEVPFPALNNWDAVNSDYCNFTKGNKNCYLVFGGDFNEDTQYSTFNFYTKNSADLYWVNKGEYCYELVDSESNYRSSYGRFLASCMDVHFGSELTGCQNCIGCVNLRNQNYRIFNEQYSAEEYKKAVAEIDWGSWSQVQEMKKKFEELKLRSIVRAAHIFNSPGSTGDNVYNAKSCKEAFDIFDGAEDSKYVFLAAGGVKDSYSASHCGAKSELLYDSLSIYPANFVMGSWVVLNSHNIQHSIWLTDCSYIFGCVGLRNKQHCILNKQYSKEEYDELVPKLVQHMKDMPYKDANGRTYGYGEFFPSELSPFAYNETVAFEYFPLTKEEALAAGFRWKDREEKHYSVTIPAVSLPDSIKDVSDDILEQVIGCAHEGNCNEGCTLAFRLIPQELAFYRQLPAPLPRLCPNCRHGERTRTRNFPKLYSRKCHCAGAQSENRAYKNTVAHSHEAGKCPNEFETTYAPDRPEILYCDQCFNAEVV